MIANVGKHLEQQALSYPVSLSVVSPLWKPAGNHQ